MSADEYLNITHRLSVLSMNEVRVLAVKMENIFKHTENEAGDSQNFAERAKAELAGDGNE